MPELSILFPESTPVASRVFAGTAPEFFQDLNLDQLVSSIAAIRKDYADVAAYYWAPLSRIEEVQYRQAVMRDVGQTSLAQAITTFSAQMRLMHHHLAFGAKLDYPFERERWFLGAADEYCGAVEQLAAGLGSTAPASPGLLAIRKFLLTYTRSAEFLILAADTRALTAQLDAITYALLIRPGRVTVMPYQQEADYATVVEKTFEKFRRGDVKDYRIRLAEAGRLNHIDAQIVERVARLHPEPFRLLAEFPMKHASFADETIARFDREVQFYIAYTGYIKPLRDAGLPFCCPRLSRDSKSVSARAAFDLPLAAKLVAEKAPVVSNDFALAGDERIIVVSGPNHGGKTTFARMFGQLHYLAALGCPVPGTEAHVYLFDQIFTHFERAEDVTTFRGKLQDDLVRVRRLLDGTTTNSIVIMNEAFASTALKDALLLNEKVVAALDDRDALAVCVTFLDELASFSSKTVSYVAGIDPHDPAIRTFKIERRPPDGLAYAAAIAEKYRVTYEWLKRRIPASQR